MDGIESGDVKVRESCTMRSRPGAETSLIILRVSGSEFLSAVCRVSSRHPSTNVIVLRAGL
jgi:hypothetical protein